MALLYRFVKIDDRPQSHVFTFIVTRSVTRDLERDINSKEFTCGYQKWAITFTRTDKVLGVYLVWKSSSEGMRVYIDFTFTILNREHFTGNESFSGKTIKFTHDCAAQGNRNYLPVSDLYSRNFTDQNGEFQLELTLGNIKTIYETHFRVPVSIFGTIAPSHYHHQPNHHSANLKHHDQHKSTQNKLESSYFTFGGFDWNVALFPMGSPDCAEKDPKVSVLLNRLTGFDHQCRVKYSVNLGEGEKMIDSGEIEIVSDTDGQAHGWHPTVKITDLLRKGLCRVRLEMQAANTVSELTFGFKPGPAAARGLVGETIIGTPSLAQCYDRDKQGWTLKTDCHSDTVRLHMVFKDIHNVPRNHLR